MYPGAEGAFPLYEDDGESFHYRKGEWMGIDMEWSEERRALSLRLARGSRMLAPLERRMNIRMGEAVRPVLFTGRPLEVRF